MPHESYTDAWRRIIIGDHKSWVVFANGTCVVLPDPDPAADLAAEAVALLREYGPVHAASAAGDFGTITLDPGPGWVVYGHHNDILTYVAPDEVASDDPAAAPNDLTIGLLGRSKRDQDGRELQVIHVEDRRSPE